jgi:putative membrane protein
MRWIVGGLFMLLLIGFFVVPFLYFGLTGSGFMRPGWYAGGPFFFFPFGFFIFILIAFFAFRFLFWGWGGGWRRGYSHGGWDGWGTPLEILRRRYARGEITKEQFEQMKKDLEQQP